MIKDMGTNHDYYDYDGLSDIVISHVLQKGENGDRELYVGHKSFCELYMYEVEDSTTCRIEDVTNYAIRKYDGISSRPMIIGYANWDNAVAWIKRNCSNANSDIAVNRNYHIDGYVNGNGGLYKFRIEYIDSLDY